MESDEVGENGKEANRRESPTAREVADGINLSLINSIGGKRAAGPLVVMKDEEVEGFEEEQEEEQIE